MGANNVKIVPELSELSRWVTTRHGYKLRVQCLEPSISTDTGEGDNSHVKLSLGDTPAVSQSQAIFFIHGVAGSSTIWNSQIGYFRERGYYIIAVDLLGHGWSNAPDKPHLYRFDSLAADILDIFDEMHKEANVIVGHSYGTAFAAYVADSRAGQVNKLVLMSGGAPVSLAPQTGILSLPVACLTCIKPTLSRLFHNSAFHRKSKTLANRKLAFDVPLYVLRHTMKGQVWPGGDEFFHQKILQPTLLLHGDSDRLESIDGTVQMHKVLRLSQFHTVADASHMIMMEQPEVVNQLMEKFLESDSLDTVTTLANGNALLKASPHSHTHMTKSQPNLRRATLSS